MSHSVLFLFPFPSGTIQCLKILSLRPRERLVHTRTEGTTITQGRRWVPNKVKRKQTVQKSNMGGQNPDGVRKVSIQGKKQVIGFNTGR